MYALLLLLLLLLSLLAETSHFSQQNVKVPDPVVLRLTYATPAWSGFITATDRQRVDAVISRSKRCGFCPPDMPDFNQLLEEADDQLFERI